MHMWTTHLRSERDGKDVEAGGFIFPFCLPPPTVEASKIKTNRPKGSLVFLVMVRRSTEYVKCTIPSTSGNGQVGHYSRTSSFLCPKCLSSDGYKVDWPWLFFFFFAPPLTLSLLLLPHWVLSHCWVTLLALWHWRQKCSRAGKGSGHLSVTGGMLPCTALR